MESLVVDEFIEWIKGKYGANGELQVTRGKVHSSLVMTLDYSVPGQVSIDMTDYVPNMIEGFPSECLGGHAVKSPWNENLFKVQDESKRLSTHR